MINRIVGRILTLPNIQTLKRFSTHDDFKNRNKGGNGKFFGKKERPKQEVNEPQSDEPGEKKQTHHKTVKFLKKHELKMKELQPQPKKQLRFRRKQSVGQGETQKPAPFVRPEKQESEQQLIKKSIFFSKNPSPSKSQHQKAPINFSLPQLNQFLTSPAPENKFYERMSQDLDKILLLFEGRHWKDLNQIVQGYYHFTPAIQIEKQLHSFLISNNASLYIDWLRSLGRDYKDLSDSTLKKLYNELIIQNKLKELRELLNFFKMRVFNVEYKSIQAVFSDIERDSPLKGLQQKINDKIDIILQILQIQLLYNQKNSASNKVVIYTLDEWFEKIAHLALNRQVGKAKFISLFEDIFIRHYSYINLQHIHASDLFLRIISTYYFGSYVTTQKLHLLFQDFLYQDEYQLYLVKFRDRIVEYKSKTGKFPFPNAKKLVTQFQKFYATEDLEETLFYYALVNLSNEQKDLSKFMQKRKVILNYCQHQYSIRELLNDALLNLDHNIIESRPVNASDTKIEKKKQEAKNAKNKLKLKAERALLNQNRDFFGKKNLKSNFQPKFEGSKYKLAWADYQQEKNQQQKGQDSPQKLGWSRIRRYDSYYALLAKQIEEEGNPYRKQLLQNIIKAKLNVQTQENNILLGEDQLLGDNNNDNLKDTQVNVETKASKSNSIADKSAKDKTVTKQQGQEQQQSEEEQYVLDLEDVPKQINLNAINKQKIDFNNMLAIKSAIKLQKYELAYALCQKIIMQPLIFSRTSKNISLVVKSFLLEEDKRQRIPNIQDILENVDESIFELTDEYLRSVYDRCESFDELIWNYVPPKEIKFQYWRTTLALDRAQDLIKMDVNSKLKNMQYQAQYDVLPVRERDKFINKNSKNWRLRLMDELGITEPLKDQEYDVQIQTVSDDQEFYSKMLKEKILAQGQFQQCERENSLIGGQHIEGDQAEGQNTQQAEEVQVEAAGEGNAEAAQPAQTEIAAETLEDAEKNHQAKSQEKVNAQPAHEIQQQSQSSEPIDQRSSEDKKIQESLEGYSNFDTSNTLRVKGYDFTSFLDLSRKKIKPTFEQEYEQEKQYKKHVINLHSLAEQSMVEDVHYLQNKLFQYQRHVKSIDNIGTFVSYGLWNFDFTQYALDPRLARGIAKQFRQKFYNFKKYAGKKGFQESIILDNQKMVDISQKIQLICQLKFSETTIDDLLIRRMRFFKEAEAVVKLEPQKAVEELMIWGLQSDEPMAIYLAQKIAMLTNQMISHPVALQVGNYLSHRREIPAERIERCKQCLKVVGRINRDNIYDFNHEYQHITVRKNFTDYLQKRRKDLDSTALDFLSRVDPTHSQQIQTFNLRNNMRRGHLVV